MSVKTHQGEANERAKAQANADLAVEAIDRIFARFSASPTILRSRVTLENAEGETIEVPSPPVLSKEAAALLEELLPFYDRLAQQTDNEAGLRERTAEANRRVAAIRQRLGQFDQAVRANQQAITIFEELGARLSSPGAYQLEIALGDILIRSRRPPEARSILEEAINGLTRLLTDQPEMQFVHGQLARGYSNLAVALRQSGQREAAAQAEQHAEQERDLLSPLR